MITQQTIKADCKYMYIPQIGLVLVELYSFHFAANTFDKDWVGPCDRPGNEDVGWCIAQR